MDAQQISDGLTAAQTVMTVLGSMGVVEFAKWFGEQWQKRREAKTAAVIATAETEQKQQAADHQQAIEMRKYRIAEYDAIIAQKDADIAARDQAYRAYQKFAHDRLDVASARLMEMHAKEVVTAGQMARLEERVKACEDDRAELWDRVKSLEKRNDQA